jgi:Cdc25 family phosphatase
MHNADYIGGHIRGAQNVPSRTLDAMLPALVRQLRDKETVVFHCALSQQRGPAAALRYLRERERVLAAAAASQAAQTRKTEEEGAVDAGGAAGTVAEGGGAEAEGGSRQVKDQKVYVLDRGFVGWQEVYGTDERLTEGYRKELWEDGYWR